MIKGNLSRYLIKAVEVAFALLLMDNSRLFKQKIGDNAADRIMLKVELNVHVFSKS
jgi:hypothetical protein